jgi:hypothetical protein
MADRQESKSFARDAVVWLGAYFAVSVPVEMLLSYVGAPGWTHGLAYVVAVAAGVGAAEHATDLVSRKKGRRHG